MLPSPRVLVAFHTQEGQTAKIAERISGVLTSAGATVDTFAIESAPEPTGYDLVVVGDSIHAVHHSKTLRAYLRDRADALTEMPTALFQVSLTSANPDDAHTATAHGMVQELLDDTDMSRDYDSTDWDAVDAFGADLVTLAHHLPSAAPRGA